MKVKHPLVNSDSSYTVASFSSQPVSKLTRKLSRMSITRHESCRISDDSPDDSDILNEDVINGSQPANCQGNTKNLSLSGMSGAEDGESYNKSSPIGKMAAANFSSRVKSRLLTDEFDVI